MPTGTVKSTPEAISAVQRMLSQIDGGITDSLNQFKNDGEIVADPNMFEGGAAARYRAEWPGIKSALDNAVTQLREMSNHVRQINANIQAAGGN
jgi:uncharacterized protein YukE